MTQRRDFLRQASLLAAGSLAAGSIGAGELAAQAAAAPAQGTWDMSWTSRVTGRYKMCFDAPEVSDGVCLHQARSFLAGYSAAYGLSDADLSAVLVIRHAAVPMVLDDPLWEDGMFGERTEMKDPESGEVAKRNPFIRIPAGSRHSVTWPDGALDNLMARGVVVLACDLALRNAAGQIANHKKIPRQDAIELVAKHLLPGVYRMPTGVFAACHAQGVGCGVMHAV